MHIDDGRRTCLKQIAAVLGGAMLPLSVTQAAAAGLEPGDDERARIAELVRAFMTQFSVPGFSIAFGQNGQMLLTEGYGLADKRNNEAVLPTHRFRIASISKPITSTALFTLMQQGRLGIDDKVFGSGGLLADDYGSRLPAPVTDITIRHLLTHTCGGWSNGDKDPMFQQAGLSQHELIAWALSHQTLENPPGTHYAYSNFGYCILGRVIEKLTGQAYDAWVRQNLLSRCGISDMVIGGNTLTERLPGESLYYDANGHNPYGMQVRRMDSHGGWVATPSDLVRFAMRVGDSRTGDAILSESSLKTMTTPGTVNPAYACGWNVNSRPNWWHTGSLPGTSSIMVRTAKGMCWAGIANCRVEGIAPALDKLMWAIVRCVPSWQA